MKVKCRTCKRMVIEGSADERHTNFQDGRRYYCSDCFSKAVVVGKPVCIHCNAHGDSLQEDKDKCTECKGTGLA